MARINSSSASLPVTPLAPSETPCKVRNEIDSSTIALDDDELFEGVVPVKSKMTVTEVLMRSGAVQLVSKRKTSIVSPRSPKTQTKTKSKATNPDKEKKLQPVKKPDKPINPPLFEKVDTRLSWEEAEQRMAVGKSSSSTDGTAARVLGPIPTCFCDT